MSDLSPDRKGLKALTHNLVEAVGGVGPAQRILGHKSPSAVSSAGSISFPDRWLNVDDLMDLERHAQRPIVSEWLAERCRLNPERARPVLSMEAVAVLAKEGGDSMMAIVEALSDGKVCAADRHRVARELREQRAVIDVLLDAVEAW